eukprot:scaffold118869_cov21-Tisochrysis_lutea.AAC.2
MDVSFCSVHACFQPQRDEDQFRDPLGPGNEDTIRRRLAVEAVRRKQEEKDAQARKQFESHEEDKVLIARLAAHAVHACIRAIVCVYVYK